MRYQLILIVTLVLFIFAGCKQGHDNNQAVSDSRYTCPMHPTVVRSSPGTCPVCNMSLVKINGNTNKNSEMKGNFVTIDQRGQRLAGIALDTVKLRSVASSSTFLGTVAIDEDSNTKITSRVNGRIDKLFIKANGVYIKRGMPLYQIYSEQLQGDMKEYLKLLAQNKKSDVPLIVDDLINASKSKLQLWGLTQEQISSLEKSGIANPLMTFYSAEEGYVTAVNITEGMYVEEGTPIFGIVSLKEVWIEAQLYSEEVEKLNDHKNFYIFSERDPNKTYKGTLVYNNPGLEEGKRIYLLRLKVDNSAADLIPGMPVYVSPNERASPTLAVPRSAVLTERAKAVWVLAHENTFEQRIIDTGREDRNWIEVTSGLKEGEIIVSEGGYLISSEFVLKSGSAQTHAH